jgi:hypothetical protein
LSAPLVSSTTPATTTIAYQIVAQRLRQLDVTILHERHRNGRDYYWEDTTRTLWMHPNAHISRQLWVAEDLHQLMTGAAGHLSPSTPDPLLRVIQGGVGAN